MMNRPSSVSDAGPGRVAAPHWSKQGERGSMAALRLMAWIAITLGRRVARCILHPITLYFVLFAPAARRRSARYLSRALGRQAHWRDVYHHVHAFASTVLDRVYFVAGRSHRIELQISGTAALEAAATPGAGAVLLGAHIGSFEALHAMGSTRPGLRVAMAMYPGNARMIHRVLQTVAPGLRLDIIEIGRPASALEVRDWLDAGGLVGMLGDRFLDAGRSPGSIVELPFLGRNARFTDGPLRLAMLLRKPVFFMVGLYHGGRRYEVRFEPLADFSQAGGDAAERERCLRVALGSYVARLEALCREAPYNWFNFHDFWDEDVAR